MIENDKVILLFLLSQQCCLIQLYVDYLRELHGAAHALDRLEEHGCYLALRRRVVEHLLELLCVPVARLALAREALAVAVGLHRRVAAVLATLKESCF